MRHVIDNWQAKGSVLQIVVYAVPVSPGKCRLLNRQVFQLKSKIPRTIIGAFESVIEWGKGRSSDSRGFKLCKGSDQQSKLFRGIPGQA